MFSGKDKGYKFKHIFFHLHTSTSPKWSVQLTKRAYKPKPKNDLNKFKLLRILTKRNFSGSYILVLLTYFLFPIYVSKFEVPDNLTTRKAILCKLYDSICINQLYSSEKGFLWIQNLNLRTQQKFPCKAPPKHFKCTNKETR